MSSMKPSGLWPTRTPTNTSEPTNANTTMYATSCLAGVSRMSVIVRAPLLLPEERTRKPLSFPGNTYSYFALRDFDFGFIAIGSILYKETPTLVYYKCLEKYKDASVAWRWPSGASQRRLLGLLLLRRRGLCLAGLRSVVCSGVGRVLRLKLVQIGLFGGQLLFQLRQLACSAAGAGQWREFLLVLVQGAHEPREEHQRGLAEEDAAVYVHVPLGVELLGLVVPAGGAAGAELHNVLLTLQDAHADGVAQREHRHGREHEQDDVRLLVLQRLLRRLHHRRRHPRRQRKHQQREHPHQGQESTECDSQLDRHCI